MRLLRSSFQLVLLGAVTLPVLASRTQVAITGAEQSRNGVFDSGTFSVIVNGHTENVTYGKLSSNASLAAGIAAKFSQDCSSPVSAHASGTTIIFETHDPAEAISAVSATSIWDQNDFQLASFALNTPPQQPPSFTPTFHCSPSTVVTGQSLTCAVTLIAGATSPVSLGIEFASWLTAAPDALGIAVANGIINEPPGSYAINYSYPGDPSNNIPPASGSVNVAVLATARQPTGNTLYQYQIVQADSPSGYDPAGNVAGYVDTVNGAWALGYDALNRLVSSVQAPMSGGGQYGCWAYDSYGNVLTQGISNQSFADPTSCQPRSGAMTLQSHAAYNSSNQVTSGSWLDAAKNTHSGTPQYDLVGNTTDDLINQYRYDAEGRLCAVQTGPNAYEGYLYDAEGNRVSKGQLASLTCDPTQLQLTATYFIGPDGETMTEQDRQGNWVRTEVSAAGMNLATYTPTGVHYPITDWLGTKRVVANPGLTYNNGVEETCTSLPFGDGLNCSTSLDPSPKHFTGKERDSESGLDYFGARYYASSMGRWMSPDPGKINPKHLLNPQKWNMYNYVLNNPLSMIDPDGLQEMWIQYRAFIPPAQVGIGPLTGRGDNRSFSTQENASSRVSITMHIETDPAKNGGNPLLGVSPVGINSSHTNYNDKDTPAVVVQAPTVTATQDANGNVNLNVQMNVHSGDLPAATAIRSDVNIGVNEAGTQASVSGTTSVSPAFETNIAPQGGPTTNIPVQDAPAGNRQFFQGLLQDHHVDTGPKPIKQPGQQ